SELRQDLIATLRGPAEGLVVVRVHPGEPDDDRTVARHAVRFGVPDGTGQLTERHEARARRRRGRRRRKRHDRDEAREQRSPGPHFPSNTVGWASWIST